MLAVDEDQVLADLRALAGFGKLDTGVNRPAFTDADLAAREWLRCCMQAAGLEAVIDGIGNVYGQARGADTPTMAWEWTSSRSRTRRGPGSPVSAADHSVMCLPTPNWLGSGRERA